MRQSLVSASVAILACMAAASSFGGTARSEALDMDDKDRALVAKETLKAKKDQQGNKSSGHNGKSASCGSVDIGNSDANKKGSSRIAEKEKTVIVTGNVFNTANCK